MWMEQHADASTFSGGAATTHAVLTRILRSAAFHTYPVSSPVKYRSLRVRCAGRLPGAQQVPGAPVASVVQTLIEHLHSSAPWL